MFNEVYLQSGCWQMLVRPEDVHKTAFKMRWELYEFLVMPFGVTKAPAQFMNMMNALLGEYLDKFVLVFLDDVLIYSANPQDHAEHLRKVLGKLWEHKLYTKCNVRGVSAGRYTRFPALTARVRTRTEKHSAVTDREAHKRRELVYRHRIEKGKQIHRRDHISLYNSIIR